MTSVGSNEVKTHLPQLLERVARGEKILITRHGQPVAMLVPAPANGQPDVRKLVQEMLEFRDQEGPTLGDKTTIRQLIEGGRRGLPLATLDDKLKEAAAAVGVAEYTP